MIGQTLKEERKVWADLLRIVAIYLVLVVHMSIVPTQISLGAIPTFALYAIAKTCVPLFVMLSGALLLTKQEAYDVFFKKRFLRILLPWLTWTMVYTVVIVLSLQHVSPIQFLQTFKVTLVSFWFLPMIAGLYLLTPSIRIFVHHANRRELCFLIVLWFVTISFLPFVRDSLAFPRHVDNSILRQIVSYSGYFLLGYVLTLFRPFKEALFFALFLFLLGLVWTVDAVYGQSWSNNGKVVESYFNYISPSIVVLSTGLFSLLLLLGYTLQTHLSSPQKFWLQTVSGATLGIYFIEFLLQQGVTHFYTKYPISYFYPGINNILNGLLFFILSFIAIYLLQKIPHIKRLIT